MKTRQGQLYLLQFFNSRAHLSDYFVIQAFSNQSSFSSLLLLCVEVGTYYLICILHFDFFFETSSHIIQTGLRLPLQLRQALSLHVSIPEV